MIEFEEADEGRTYKWEIEPNPYTRDFDSMVTDDDNQAAEAIKYAAERSLWDDFKEGETRTLTVRMNKPS